jgi:hypothetical protein
LNIGAKVRFKAHGETGLPMLVITRDGDDVTLQDPRGRLLMRTPIELLEFVEPDGDKPWREVDSLEAC